MSVVRSDGLTPKQELAVAALLNEPTVARAAVAVGVNDRTLYRWLEEPAFRRAYRSARREAFGHAVSLAQRYAPLAVQTLTRICADEKAAAATRVAAAVALLKVTRESIELDDLAERVEALEAASKGAA